MEQFAVRTLDKVSGRELSVGLKQSTGHSRSVTRSATVIDWKCSDTTTTTTTSCSSIDWKWLDTVATPVTS